MTSDLEMEIYGLGTCRVLVRKDKEILSDVTFSHKKAFGILFMLINSRKPVSVRRICETIWKDMDPEFAVQNFYSNFTILRRHLKLPRNTLFVKSGRCHLNVERIKVDWEEFDHLLNQALLVDGKEREEKLLEAKKLYRGHFLPSFIDEEWTDVFREEFREKYLLLLQELVKYYFETNHLGSVFSLVKELLMEDPYNEIAHFYRFSSYMKMGHIVKARREYENFAKRLKRELGISPSFSFSDLQKFRAILVFSQNPGAIVVEPDVFQKYLSEAKEAVLIELTVPSLDGLKPEHLSRLFRGGDVVCLNEHEKKIKILLHNVPTEEDMRKEVVRKVIERLRKNLSQEVELSWEYLE